MNEIDFEQGRFGTKATIKVKWHDSLLDSLLKVDIRELELNIGKGWRGKDIDFLKELPQLRSLIIGDLTLKLIEPIHFLHNLQKLELETYSDVPVDFTSFPNLTDCWFEWIKGSDSLFECKGLKSLGLNNFKGKSSEPFSSLSRLEKFSLLNSGVEELNGVFELTSLRSIRIARLRKLISIKGIKALKDLEELEISACKNIDSFSEIFSLSKLRTLFLLNTGNVETLHGIENLKELEKFIFYEATNIVDGDLSPILRLKKLMKISFQNRNHYSHRKEDFGKLYS